MRGLCDEIDHKVLLPLQNPKIQIGEDGESVKVAYEGKPRYVFPTQGLRAAADPEHDRGDAGGDARRTLPCRAAKRWVRAG